MGILDSLGGGLDRFMKSIRNVTSEAFDTIKSTCGDVVRAVNEGDWLGAIKECVQAIEGVGAAIDKSVTEVNKVIFDLTGLDQIVEPLLAGLKSIGQACMESFEKYPGEWLEVTFSLIAAAALFAVGDVPQAVGMVVSGVTKAVRLFDKIDADDPGFSERYPMPPQFRQIAEQYETVPNHKVDEHLLREVEDL